MTAPFSVETEEQRRRRRLGLDRLDEIAPPPPPPPPRDTSLWGGSALFGSGGVRGRGAPPIDPEQVRAARLARLERVRTGQVGRGGRALHALSVEVAAPVMAALGEGSWVREEREALGDRRSPLEWAATATGAVAPYIAASLALAPGIAAAATAGSARALAAGAPKIARVLRALGSRKSIPGSIARGSASVLPVNLMQSASEETALASGLAPMAEFESERVRQPSLGGSALFGPGGVRGQVPEPSMAPGRADPLIRALGRTAQAASGTFLGRFAFEQGFDLGAGAVVEPLAVQYTKQSAKRALGQQRGLRDAAKAAARAADPGAVAAPATRPQIHLPRRPGTPWMVEGVQPLGRGMAEAPPVVPPEAQAALRALPQPGAGVRPWIEMPGGPGVTALPPSPPVRPAAVQAAPAPAPVREAAPPVVPEPPAPRPYVPPPDIDRLTPTEAFREGQRAAAALGLRPPTSVAKARSLLRRLAPEPAPAPVASGPALAQAVGEPLREAAAPPLPARTPALSPQDAPRQPISPAPSPEPVPAEIVPQAGAERRPLPRKTEPNPEVQQVASRYVARAGVEGQPLPRPPKVDEERATAMARVFENLKSDPANPEVRAAYRAMADEVRAQYKEIEDAGFRFEFVDEDPYKTSADMMRDLRENRRLKVYKTAEGQQHPLLTREENDMFRAVHDFFGHAQEGNQFGPLGEELAFRDHSRMFSPLARRAMATETRGQNSWFNFGPHRDLPPGQRPFAEQKAALWPEEFLGDYGTMPRAVAAPETPAPRPRDVRKERYIEAVKQDRRAKRTALNTDPATGLGTREAMDRAYARLAKELGDEPYVASLDVRGLKALNDEVSHKAGDEFLTRVGQALKQAANEEGLGERLVFRPNRTGDEFIVLGSDVGLVQRVVARANEIVGDVPIGKTGRTAGIEGVVARGLKAADEQLSAFKRGRPRTGDRPPAGPGATAYAGGASLAAGLALEQSENEELQAAGRFFTLAGAAGAAPFVLRKGTRLAKDLGGVLPREAEERFFRLVETDPNGFSFNVRTGQKETDGNFVGGVVKRPLVVDELSETVLRKAVSRFHRELEDPSVVLGAWRDPRGRIVIEPATKFDDLAAARQAAVDRGEEALGILRKGRYREERILRHHTGHPDLTTINPEYMGTGPHFGAERMRRDRVPAVHFYGNKAKPEPFFKDLPAVYTVVDKDKLLDLRNLKQLVEDRPELADLAKQIRAAKGRGENAVEKLLAKEGYGYTTDGEIFKLFDEQTVWRKGGVPPHSRHSSVVSRDLASVEAARRKGRRAKPEPLVRDEKLSTKKRFVYRTKDAIYPDPKRKNYAQAVARAEQGFYDDIEYALMTPDLKDKGAWYGKDLAAADGLVKREFPELRSAPRMAVYNLLRAMTSAGNAPTPNEEMAYFIYKRWRFGRTGQPLTAKAPGIPQQISTKEHEKRLARLEADLRRFTVEAGGDPEQGLRDWYEWAIQPQPRSARAPEYPLPLPNAVRYLATSSDALKTTNYWSNLMGFYDRFTGDTWMTRQLRRHLGYSIDEKVRVSKGEKGGKAVYAGHESRIGLQTKPTRIEYAIMEEAWRRVQRRLAEEYPGWNPTIAELQSLGWFREKALYLRNGARDSGRDSYLQGQLAISRGGRKKGQEYGFLDEAETQFRLAPVRKGVKSSLKRRERDIALMAPSERWDRARRIAKEMGLPEPKTLAEATDLVRASAYGFVQPDLLFAMAAILPGLAGGEEVPDWLKALGFTAAGALLGARFARARLKDTKVVREVAGPKPATEAPAEKVVVARAASQYERGTAAGTIGTPKTDEPLLTPAMLALDPSGEQWAEEIVRAAKRGDYRVTVSDEEALRQTNFVDLNSIMKDAKTARTTPEVLALGAAAVRGKDRAVSISQQLNDLPAHAVEEKEALLQEYRAALVQVDAALSRASKGISEAGRTLRMARQLEFLAANVQDPTFWIREARRASGLPEGAALPDETVERLMKILTQRRGQELTKEQVKALASEIRRVRPQPGIVRQLLELTRIGLLTLPATQAANVAGNVGRAAAAEGVMRPSAALFDRLLTRLSKHGERTATASLAVTRAAWQGAKKGAREVVGREALQQWQQAKTLGDRLRASKSAVQNVLDGMHEDSVVRLLDRPGIDWEHTGVGKLGNGATARVLQTYQGLVYGQLAATDKVFRAAALESSLRMRAEVRALNAGLKRGTPAFDDAVRRYMTAEGVDPIDLAEAIFQSEAAAFMEPNELARLLQGLRQIKGLGAAAEAFMPFILTPTNIVKQTVVDFSPAQLLRPFFGDDGLRSTKGWRYDPRAQRRVVEAMGRGTVGTMVLGAGAFLYLNGRVTGPEPRDPEDARQATERNVPFNSVQLVDGSWINAARLGPVGMMLIIGGELARALEDGSVATDGLERGTAAARALLSPLRVALDLPMLQGTKDIIEALRRDDALRRVGGSLLGRLSPSLLGGIARGLDPVGARERETPLDYLRDRVPLWRETLPEKRTGLGRTVPGRSMAAELFLPGYRKERTGPLLREFQETGYWPSPLAKRPGETDAQFRARRRQVDPAAEAALQRLIATSRYQRADVGKQGEMLRQEMSRARRVATARADQRR